MRRRVMKENVAPEGPAATRPGRPQSRNIPVHPDPLMGPTDPKHPGDARPSLGMARTAAGTTRMAHFSSAMAGNTGCTVSDAAEPFERLGRMETRAPRGAEEAAAELGNQFLARSLAAIPGVAAKVAIDAMRCRSPMGGLVTERSHV